VSLTLLGLFYVIYRAIELPLAPDEWGVLRSIHTNHFADHFTANDWKDWNAQAQFPNLVLSRICFHLFWLNEILRIRIPSLLSFGIFLWAIWRIRQRFTTPLVGRLTLVALLSNAFVLDYFGVSRGYGLAMAFAAVSLAALFRAEDGKSGWVFLAVWSAALAVLSNMSFLYFFLAILLITLSLPRYQSFSRPFWLASSALVLGAFYAPRLAVMQRHHLLYFGGNSGFVSDTVASLVKCMFYEGSPFYPFPTTRFEIMLAWTIVGLAVFSATGLYCRRDRRGMQFSACLLAIVLMIYGGYYLMHIPFPVERAAVYFIPLFILQIACLADGTSIRWLRVSVSGLLLALSVTAAWGLNLTHMCISKVMADIPALIQDLAQIHQRTNKPVVLCLSDGTKWQVWYYAELATKTPENERLQASDCFAHFDWLHIYEPHCGLPPNEGRLSTPATTDLFLSSDDDPPTWFPHRTVLVREYPVSHWRLYSNIEEAIPHDEDILRLPPDFADGHYSMGSVLMGQGKIEEAIAHFEQALQLKPDYADVHENMGIALAQTGKLKEAIAHFEQALRMSPNSATAHFNLGLALAQTGSITEAIAHFEQALRIKPDLAEAHNHLGVALAQAGKFQQAIAHYQQALQLKPDFAEAQNNLGIDLAQEGRIQEAIPHFEQALRIKPDYAEAHYNLAIDLEKTGRLPEAVEHYQQALRIKPDFTPARNALDRLRQTSKLAAP
jgi:tetratricopeptide (TPR) repeat protein